MLKGAELLAKVAQLGDTPKNVLVEACGYVNKAGKPSYAAFYEALVEAKGVKLAPPTTTSKPKRGKPLSFTAKVAKSGTVPITAGYTTLLGLAPEDRVTIEHIGDTLVLRKAGAEACQAPVTTTVTTYESHEAAASAAPARELAPF